jgi:hypothetical protein
MVLRSYLGVIEKARVAVKRIGWAGPLGVTKELRAVEGK